MAGMARRLIAFSRRASQAYRAIFIQDWCGFCVVSATHPVDPRGERWTLPWLAQVASEGDAVLYRVIFRPGAALFEGARGGPGSLCADVSAGDDRARDPCLIQFYPPPGSVRRDYTRATADTILRRWRVSGTVLCRPSPRARRRTAGGFQYFAPPIFLLYGVVGEIGGCRGCRCFSGLA